MALNDLREAFPTTEDRITGAGVALAATTEGQSADKQGSIVFAFKDRAGNTQIPTLDLQGRLPVSVEIQGTRLRAKGTTPGGVLDGSGAAYTGFTVVCAIPLTNTATGLIIGDMRGRVSCRRGALFQLCYQDAGNVVVLDEAMVDAGQYSAEIGLDGDEFDVPASAVSPQMYIRAGNFQIASDLHSTLKVVKF